jgi:hypothetical protein
VSISNPEVTSQRSYVVETSTSMWDVKNAHFVDLTAAIAFAQEQQAADQRRGVLVHLNDTSTVELFRAPGFLGMPGPDVLEDRSRDYRQVLIATRKDGRVVWDVKYKTYRDVREQAFGLIGTGSYEGAPVLAIIYRRAAEDCLLKLGANPQLYPKALLAPERPASSHIPDGPIIGFRCWRVEASSAVPGQIVQLDKNQPEYQVNLAVLRSLHVNRNEAPSVSWASPQVLFGCLRGHAVPNEQHHCGIYAYNQLYDAVWEMERESEADPTTSIVIGLISGHGDVLVHDKGWRAEEAHLLAFADLDAGSSPQLRQHLSAQFDIPLVSDIEGFATSHGRIIHKWDIPDAKSAPQLEGGLRELL